MCNLPNVLFLCTGNSCRSQMAEGFLRHDGSDRFSVYSAGTEPKDEIHPLAVLVMQEAGIEIGNQRPKHLKEYLGHLPVRHLIIVCDAANDRCPSVWPGMMNRHHWPFDDPAVFEGPDVATLQEFRRVRDQIQERIKGWLAVAA